MEQAVSYKFSLTFERKKGKFTLTAGDEAFQQNVCEFLLTNSYFAGKDIEQHLFNVDSEFDTVRIPLTSAGKCLTLDLVGFIRLRELYHQQMYFLKLEEMLTHRGVSMPNSL